MKNVRFDESLNNSNQGNNSNNSSNHINNTNNNSYSVPRIRNDPRKQEESLKIRNSPRASKRSDVASLRPVQSDFGHYESFTDQILKNSLEIDLQSLSQQGENRLKCNLCNRNFNEEAYKTHIKICKGVFKEKRETFNAKIRRVQQPTLEQYVEDTKYEPSIKPPMPRSQIRLLNHKENTYEHVNEKYNKEVVELKLCSGCGRKFANLDVHEPPCKKRFEQQQQKLLKSLQKQYY